jgi:hypothetical protein
MQLEEDDKDEKKDGRNSNLVIEVALSIGYRRKRPDTKGDKWEARFDSIGLMIVGAIVTLVIVIVLLPRILQLLAQL